VAPPLLVRQASAAASTRTDDRIRGVAKHVGHG
jgi:hypothetical protein